MPIRPIGGVLDNTKLQTLIKNANDVGHDLARTHTTGRPVSATMKADVRTVLGAYPKAVALTQNPRFQSGASKMVLKNALKYLTNLYALATFVKVDNLPIQLQTKMTPTQLKDLIARELV